MTTNRTSKYLYQIRSYAAPLGRGEYEIISTHEVATEADRQYRQLYSGTTAVLDHNIVVIDQSTGRVWSLDEAPDDAIAPFAFIL